MKNGFTLGQGDNLNSKVVVVPENAQKESIKDELKKKAIQRQFAQAALEIVVKGSPEIVDQVFQRMIESKDNLVEGVNVESLDEDEIGPDEEDEYDGNLDLVDEDEIVEEPEPGPCFKDDFSTPFIGGGYDIEAVVHDGKNQFVAPENEYAGARGVSAEAKSCLAFYSIRMELYGRIAEQLQKKVVAGAGVDEQIRPGMLGSQKDFVESLVEKQKGEKPEVYKKRVQAKQTTLSKALESARLKLASGRLVVLRDLFS